jgi:antitoxin (DNA-binding transcriptional repressor) of toxin-antitoxin stability system
VKKTNISTLKKDLSRYLDYVKSGGVVRIFDRDTPVGEIVPLGRRATAGGDALDAAIEKKVRDGSLRSPQRKLVVPAKLIRARRSVVEALVEERRQGR